MTWVKLDDGFEDHGKVATLSDAAHRLYVRALCWSHKPVNARSRGFIPRALLPEVARRSHGPKRLEKLAAELVGATGGGMYEHGLWEATDDGWHIHDWERYLPADGVPADPDEVRRKRSEAGRKGANARWQTHSEADGKRMANAWQTDAPVPVPVPVPVPATNPSGLAAGPPTPPPDYTDSEAETICPLDLVDRARKAEVLTQLADGLKQPLPSIEAKAQEFVAYWSIGAGAGQKRRHWMRRLRKDIHEAAKRNQLTPPGALEHGAGHGHGNLSPKVAAFLRGEI